MLLDFFKPIRNRFGKLSIVPDGCSNMVFHCGEPYRQYLDEGHGLIQPDGFIIRQSTRPLMLEPLGDSHIFAVRFQPCGLAPLLADGPLSMPENQPVALHQIFGTAGNVLIEKVLIAKNDAERIISVEAFLHQRLRNKYLCNKHWCDVLIDRVTKMVLQVQGQISVKELAYRMHLSQRQLERRFLNQTGLQPKQFIKIIRLKHALGLILDEALPNLTDIACESEYHDQSHFIREFKELTGFTPKRFQRSKLQMQLFYAR